MYIYLYHLVPWQLTFEQPEVWSFDTKASLGSASGIAIEM